jgi:DnaK suppressor protein
VQLRMIEEALDRIEAGDYGICLGCEEQIPAKRLQAVPWAKFCVQCQQSQNSMHEDAAASVKSRVGIQNNW